MKAILLSFSSIWLSVAAFGQPNIVLSNTTDSRAAQSINDNFTEMDRKKANVDDLTVYVTKTGSQEISGANTISGVMTITAPPIVSVDPASTPTVNAIYSKSVPKLWVTFAADGSISDALNVSSVTVISTGHWDVNITRAFANTGYSCSCTAEPSLLDSMPDNCGFSSGLKHKTRFRIVNCNSTDGSFRDTTISLICFGSQ